MRPHRRTRGVYELEFSGPGGEQLLFSVDRHGHFRRHVIVHGPAEREIGLAVLRRHLEAIDPVRPSLRAI